MVFNHLRLAVNSPDIVILALVAVLGGGDGVAFLEEAAEGAAGAEAGSGGDVIDGHLGTGDKQFPGILQTAVVDEIGDSGKLAALREGCADALLRQVEVVDGGLTVELRVEIKSLTDNDIL